MKKSLENIDVKLSSALPALKTELSHLFNQKLRKIILYGSYARGNYDNESDVDILVIVNDKELSKHNKVLSQIELELFNKYNLLFSIIPESEKYFLKNSKLLPFFRTVSAEGIVVYG